MTSQVLEASLRKTGFEINLQYAKNWTELEAALAIAPALVFCPSELMLQREQRVLDLLQQRSPDSICVKVSQRHWEPIKTRALAVEICAISVSDIDLLQQQIDYLLHYSTLKYRFRQCKHLLSIAELRCQWLVDYAREPVAFVARGRHLHANVAYLSLFGFSSETEALSTALLNLVELEEREVFSALCANAERSACPSNRLLLTLKRFNKQSFRAEIRFIPSVFRGMRCVQLHVHPLIETTEQRLPNPWEQPVKLPNPKVMQNKLSISFQETLNLRATKQASLLIAEPALHYANGKVLSYEQLLVDTQKKGRFQLDAWTIRQALAHLKAVRQQQGASPLVLVELGEWIFKNTPYLKELIKILQNDKSLASSLVLAIPIDLCLAYSVLAKRIFPVLKNIGVKIALDKVNTVSVTLLSQSKQLSVDMMRLSTNITNIITKESAVPQNIHELIDSFDQIGLMVIVNGINDITTLNLSCITKATYLQGSILNKFKK